MGNSKTLNAFISSAGVCSRRKAVDHIKSGAVTVNGVVRTDPGYRVAGDEQVAINGVPVKSQTNFVYVLLNKPRDYITTCSDERGRKTVLDLLVGLNETVFPVGRLDRNTTGLLLLTNDGMLAQSLSHPSNKVLKEYQVMTNLQLENDDLAHIREGVLLDDGHIKVDQCVRTSTHTAEVSLHSGKYRIIRRLFEHFGYEVTRLDRTVYAGLTKKGLTVGEWRHLREDEVMMLKQIKK